MTFLDVSYKENSVRSPTVMKNIATEYTENVYSRTSHRTLSIIAKVWIQTVVITTTFFRLTNRNILVKSIKNIVIQIKHNLLRREQTGCVAKHT